MNSSKISNLDEIFFRTRTLQKQLKFFSANPKHPSLKTHKLKGSLSGRWSISIEVDIRMIYYLNGDEAVFFDIGTHDEVYRKNKF